MPVRSQSSQWPPTQITDSEPRPQGAGWWAVRPACNPARSRHVNKDRWPVTTGHQEGLKKMTIRSLFLPLLAAGILSAQAAQRPHHQMLQDLNLTADQQTQVRAIFRDRAAQSKDLVQKLREER